MTRRRRSPGNTKHSAIGNLYTIKQDLAALAQREISATIKTDLTENDAYELLVPADVRKALKTASQYVNAADLTPNVDYSLGLGVQVRVRQEKVHALLCSNQWIGVAGNADPFCAPLITLRDELLVLDRKWRMVEYTLEWMDQNLTSKAVRWLLPAIKTLKGATNVPDEIDHKTVIPALGAMLPLIRETGVILSGAQFLPKDLPERADAMTIYLTNTSGNVKWGAVSIAPRWVSYVV